MSTDHDPVPGPASIQDALGSLYNTVVLDLFEHPHNAGRCPPGPDVIEGEAGCREDGAQVRFSGRVAEGRITEIRFQAYGCPHTLAAAAWLTDRLAGRSIDELEAWNWRELADRLQVPLEKRGRLLILEDAVRALARAWRQRR